jgi:hypothetical protein
VPVFATVKYWGGGGTARLAPKLRVSGPVPYGTVVGVVATAPQLPTSTVCPGAGAAPRSPAFAGRGEAVAPTRRAPARTAVTLLM